MVIGRKLATLKFKELTVLGKIFLSYPKFLLPTYRATRKALTVSDQFYKNLHHENNRTNAFRHALWNYLICKYCTEIAGSRERAVIWSKEITDLHERLSPNEPIAKKMDLHNNRIGREIFLQFSGTEEEAISILLEKTESAVQVNTLEEIEEEKENLVYLEKLRHRQ